jgi:hypothetical protein
MFDTPVLFIVFNRPEVTFRVFEQLRKVKPSQLFIAADGPRADKPGEAELCARTRSVAGLIDWDCELKTLFRDENAGCGRAVSEAITWFFQHHEQGIILEDDCLPDPSFFTFCANMLDHFKHQERVMHIGGNNSQFGRRRGPHSYYFSKYPHIWGWATWKRAWERFRFDLSDEDLDAGVRAIFSRYHFSEAERAYWTDCFQVMKQRGIDTWDIQWTYSCWVQGGMTVVPNVNLISNIGFDSNATHTRSRESKLANQPVRHLGELVHNPHLVIDDAADAATFHHYNQSQPVSWYHHLRQWASRMMPRKVKDKLKKSWHS